MLFHYTSAAAVKGIIEQDRIWATSYLFKNDSSELKYGVDLFSGWVINNLTDRKVAQAVNIEVFGSYLTDLISNLAHPFTFSVCGHSDPFLIENGLLSQWRAYGDGGGYCIIFDEDGFLKRVNEFTDRYVDGDQEHKLAWSMSGECNYDGKITEPDYYDQFAEHLDSLVKGITTDDFLKSGTDASQIAFIKAATNAGIFYKHRGFAEEDEFRVAFGASRRTIPPNFATFERSGSIVPLLELFGDLGVRKTIKSIIVGPHEQADERAAAIKMLCKANRIPMVEVRTSSIPLRP
jgi:hypothetical protein